MSIQVIANNKTMVYGGTAPELSARVVGDVGSFKPTYTLSREPGDNVGEYVITVTGDAVQGNFSVTYENGKFTITPRDVQVQALNATKTYGEDDPELKVRYVGLLEGESVSYTTLTRAPGDDVGEYTITVTGATEQGNYKVTFVGATFTISPKTAKVIAENKVKTYGDADPELTVRTEGLVGDDKLIYTVERAHGNDVGTYTITPSGDAVQGNYKVVYETGN